MELKKISLETHKAIKEIGFDLVECNCGGYPECICTEENKPTQALVQMWLREKHGLYLYIIPHIHNGYEYYIESHTHRLCESRLYEASSTESSYEEALELGILKAITIVKYF